MCLVAAIEAQRARDVRHCTRADFIDAETMAGFSTRKKAKTKHSACRAGKLSAGMNEPKARDSYLL